MSPYDREYTIYSADRQEHVIFGTCGAGRFFDGEANVVDFVDNVRLTIKKSLASAQRRVYISNTKRPLQSQYI